MKGIVNRLKPVMPLLVAENQTSFVGGRYITDNIVVAQEIIHSMRVRKGKKGWMAIKIDMKKAYDRLRWDFIRSMPEDASIPSSMVRLIMNCMSTSSMQVLWNGGSTDEFKPTRGIRQRDPMSPICLFLLWNDLGMLLIELPRMDVGLQLCWVVEGLLCPIYFLRMT